MRNTEAIANNRPITDSELGEVTGGHPAVALVGAAAIVWGAVVGSAWDMPLGATKEQAAGALGMGHLL